MTSLHLFGVDASKAEHVAYDGVRLSVFGNNEKGIRAWISCLPPGSVIALEPTASFGDLLARRAFEAGHTVFMVQPSWIKAHRRSSGKRAKTDTEDAKLIYDYVQEKRSILHPWKPFSQAIEELRKLVRQRVGLAEDIGRTRKRCKALGMSEVMVQAVLRSSKEVLEDLNKRLKEKLASIPEARFLLSIHGIGPVAAGNLLVVLKHIEFRHIDSFIAWIGIDPVPNESATITCRRCISKKGSKHLRTALFIAAMSASRTKTWKPRYEALVKNGLAPRQALIALAKKMATIAFHLYRLKVEFDPRAVKMKT